MGGGRGTVDRSHGGQVHHVEIVSCHELDVRCFPGSCRVGSPGNITSSPFIENIAGRWPSWYHIRANERCGKDGGEYCEHYEKQLWRIPSNE